MSRLRLTIACILGTLWLVGSITLLVAQQEQSNWAEPVNLSQSGATVSPVMAMDNAGNLHILWQDNYLETYKYQFQAGDGWSTAITVTLPFSLSVPRLMIDQNNQMHVFWQGADGDDDKSVSYSRVPITAVSDPTAWSSIQTLTGEVVDYDVALDDWGQLHLLYIRPDERVNAPAGVYHNRTVTDDAGAPSWLGPTLLYESSYFRDLSESNANVELVTAVSGDDSWIFAAWDNRSRKQIFFARSGDGGAAWEAPVEIVGPESGSSSIIPFNVMVGVKDDNVVLVWNKGQPGVSCQQYFVASPDLGVSWSERVLMDDLLPGTPNCVRENEFIVGQELLFLLSNVQNQQFMWAWDGSHWSPPVAQPILTSFDNPETLNAVVFRCQQKVSTQDDRLLVVGCEEDIRTFGDGDIWLLSRPLGTADEWFPPPTVWQPFDTIHSNAGAFHSFVLMPGTNGELLAFWTLADDLGTDAISIVNARMSEERWLLPETVLTVAGAEIGSPLAATTSPAGQLYLTWTDDLGQLYLAQTAVANAHIASLWSQVAEIPLEHGASFPAIDVDDKGVLYLAYTIAVNEGRGIYLVTSDDGGHIWSDPLQVFDGAAAGWEVVGPTTLAVAGNGQVHLQWEQRSIFSNGLPKTQALYYAFSVDGGQTFAPESLVAEGFIPWNEFVTIGEQEFHRFWQVADDEAVVLLHAHSENGGQSWSQPTIVNATPGAMAVTNDSSSVFLLFLTDTAVQEWHWQDDKWALLTEILLDEMMTVDAPDHPIAATLSPTGVLATLFVGRAVDADQEADPVDNLYASSRVVQAVSETTAEQPPVPSTEENVSPVSPTTAPTAEAPLTPTAVAIITPTPKPAVAANLTGAEEVPPMSGTMTLILGFLPAVLLVVVVFGFGVWRMRNRPAKD